MNLHRWCLANEQIGWPTMMFYSYAILGKWPNLTDIFSNGLKPRMLGQTCFWLENSEPDLFHLWSSWAQHGKLFRNSGQLIVQHPGIKISMNHPSVKLPKICFFTPIWKDSRFDLTTIVNSLQMGDLTTTYKRTIFHNLSSSRKSRVLTG